MKFCIQLKHMFNCNMTFLFLPNTNNLFRKKFANFGKIGSTLRSSGMNSKTNMKKRKVMLQLNTCLSCIQNFIPLASTVFEISCHKDRPFPMEKINKTTGPLVSDGCIGGELLPV